MSKIRQNAVGCGVRRTWASAWDDNRASMPLPASADDASRNDMRQATRSTFTVTFLGHHSWVFSTRSAAIVVDPLLCDGFGHTPEVGLRVYPPRAFDLSRFPRMAGVFLTHEHEGHFDLPSLAKLDRQIPIWIPERSSEAMRQALRSLGFRQVKTSYPGDVLSAGDLRLLPLTSDQVNDAIIDEWDSTAYVVYDTGGHGSFFSHVDMPVSAGMTNLIHATLRKPPAVWARTNNFHDCYFQYNFGRPTTFGLAPFVSQTVQNHRSLAHGAERPRALTLAGGGFSLPRESPVNRNAFTWNSDQVAKALEAVLPGERVVALRPGHTLTMRDGEIADITEKAPFVRCEPPRKWPDRTFRGNVRWLESYAPVTRRRTLTPVEWSALEQELAKFASFLYGRDTYRSLYSLSRADLHGKRPTFCVAALAGSSPRATVFEYEPHACRFRKVDCSDPFDEYIATYECWAPDLLAFLRAEISPTALSFARSRTVNQIPRTFSFPLNGELFKYAHPLRMPDRFLTLYEKVIATTEDSRPAIRAAHSGRSGRPRSRAK